MERVSVNHSMDPAAAGRGCGGQAAAGCCKAQLEPGQSTLQCVGALDDSGMLRFGEPLGCCSQNLKIKTANTLDLMIG